MKEVKLGSRVRDMVTGIEGVAVARLEYMNGCVRYEVQPRGDKDGAKIASLWVDVQQMQVEVLPDTAEKEKPPVGGPGSTPPKHRIPS